jgi:uncharacterized protein YodC (DUF2158 family)
MSEEINAGDTVKLKSGGPPMTVDSIDNRTAWCSWFDSKGDLKTGSFPLTSLVVSK